MKKILLFLLYFLLSENVNAQTSINITYANDSIEFFGYCGFSGWGGTGQFTLEADISGYAAGDTLIVKTFFGDGTYQTYLVELTNGNDFPWVIPTHSYLQPGIYDVTYTITGPDGNSDTLFHPQEVVLISGPCVSYTAHTYIDNNLNCIYDPGDVMVPNQHYTLYNGVSVTGASNGALGVAYPGINYTLLLDTAGLFASGYTLVCPLTNTYNFTPVIGGTYSADFAVQCNPNFDLSVHSGISGLLPGNSPLIGLTVNNVACMPQSGTYTINLDPRMTFVVALTPPSSGSGASYQWNFSNLGFGSIKNYFYCNLDPSVQIGDTICYVVSVLPISGDLNPSNNSIIQCSVVRASFDPNNIEVNPQGDGLQGNIAPGTKLAYTINFQNTGNDTAKNVFILDTLDIDFDINSIHILGYSHPMQLYIIDGHILKFDFRSIYLPDSGANEMLSHGFVMYEINHKNNLPLGTGLTNTAGIYFDSNAPVITNTTLNTLFSPVGIQELNATQFNIYPNPSDDVVNISSDLKINGIEIKDVSGRIVEFVENSTSFSVSQFYEGIYFVNIFSENKTFVRKLIVQH